MGQLPRPKKPQHPIHKSQQNHSWAVRLGIALFCGGVVWATRNAPQAVSTAAVRRTGGSQAAVNYWLRADNTACVNGAAEFLRQMVQGLPQHIRLGLARGASALLSQPPASRRPLPPTKQRRDLN